MTLTALRRPYITLMLIFALALSVTPVYASPRSDKVSRARAIQGQVNALDDKVEAATERYNEAVATHAALVSKRRKAERKIASAKRQIGKLQGHLNSRAENMYRSGSISFVDVLLGAQDFAEFAATWDFLRNLNEGDASSVADLKIAKADYEAARRTVKSNEREAARQLGIAKSTKRSITSQLAQRKSMLNGIESEIAALDQQARARAAQNQGIRGWFKRTFERRFPPPTRGPRSSVVAIAKRYLGARYVWGASGPNTFDCSGFTSYVYRQVGVSLPRTSREQIHAGQRVSRGDLQPGDLVFFGSPIHHVGIYIGGGMMIHSPHTGDVVSIDPAFRSNYAGACRP